MEIKFLTILIYNSFARYLRALNGVGYLTVSIILILNKLLLRNKGLLRHEILGLRVIHSTSIVLVHLLLYLTRLVIHLHLLLLLLSVQNLHAFILSQPALVAVLTEGEVVVEAGLAGPVADVSLLVSSCLSFLLSVVKGVVVLWGEFYDSITSSNTDKLITLLHNFVHFRCFLNFHKLSLLLGDFTIFLGSFFLTLVACGTSFAVKVLTWWALPSNHWVNFNILDKRLNRENRTIFCARIVTIWGIISSWLIIIV